MCWFQNHLKMKIKIILTSILLFCGTILNAQNYKSSVQTDRNANGVIKTLFHQATLKLKEGSIWIKFDELKEGMELFFYKKAGVRKNEKYVRTIYILTDETRNNTGYSFLFVDKYFQPQLKGKVKYDMNFTVEAINNEKYMTTENIEVVRFTNFFSSINE